MMLDDFPDNIIDYINPCNLELFRSVFYSYTINSNFEELNFISLKCPPLKLGSPFLLNPQDQPKVQFEVPLCCKPDFLSQGISCNSVETFVLRVNDSDKSSINDNDYVDGTKSANNIMPKLILKQQKFQKANTYDENFAVQISLSETSKPLTDLVSHPAWNWPFELDIFQKQAILALENSKSVFVAAHTSAGKTVVAEYAIAMCQQRGARVIYTSPIKALSNQKFREFKKTFGNDNVGLLTGDIKTGANRYILIMTTEILHNMLKNDCSTLRDLEIVIMDEVHYLNDESRGHIWEQIMILLPKNIQLVMLSATVPNTMQFAEWLGRIRQTQIQVISTVKRPVPLEVFLFLGTGRTKRHQIYKIMDANKNFNIHEYQLASETKRLTVEKAMKKYQSRPINTNQQQQQQNPHRKTSGGVKQNKFQNADLRKPSANYNATNSDQNQWLALFETLQEKDNLPVICFLFSRNRIQSTVKDLKSLNYLNEVEKSNVRRYFKEIIHRKFNNNADRNLPQVLEMMDMLERGVGMHHAGLLPILKEIVEILFSQGYVKILFATETFAVGVNMPARSVVFDSIEKHDGTNKRILLPGEFTQMAGRAGRRGLDKIGNVIILAKPKADLYSQDELKRLLIGSASQLESKFKISYNMILSLYRNRQFNIQYMIRHSFIEAGRLKNYEENCQDHEKITSELKSIHLRGLNCTDKNCDLDQVEKFYKKCMDYRELKKSFSDIIENKNEIQNLLAPGRIILLDSSNILSFNLRWRYLIPAVVLSLDRQTSGSDKYKVKVFTHDLSDQNGKAETNTSKSQNSSRDPDLIPIRLLQDEVIFKTFQDVNPKILTVSVSDINTIYQSKAKIEVREIEKHWQSRFFRKCSLSEWIDSSSSFRTATQLICSNSLQNLEMINYEKELNIKDLSQKCIISMYFSFASDQSPLLNFQCCDCNLLAEHFEYINVIEKLISRLRVVQQNLSDDSLAFLPEYQSKVNLLKELNYINSIRDIIRLKGRIACEIESYEIVVTELILTGVFQNAAPSDIAAALSCLMYESKFSHSSNFKLKDSSQQLQLIIKELYSVIEKINKCQNKMGILGNEIEANCALVEPIRRWASGATFAEIVELTDVQYGDIVRCVQRIYELLRHCESAAKVMADFSLAALFKRTQERLYRGVISTPSLYVDDVNQ